MRGFTDNEILGKVTKAENYKGFPGSITTPEFLDVWIRDNSPNPTDKFQDKVFTYECYGNDKTPVFKMRCTGTSQTGKYGLLNFLKWNKKGVAVLKTNYIVYHSHVFGLHKGKAAYIQAHDNRFVPFPYYRDNNKNLKAEEIGQIYWDRIGANCHRASWLSLFIGLWSIACLVRNNLNEFLAWLKLLNKRPLSVVIFNEKDF